MDENLSEAAGILTGAPLETELETTEIPQPETKPDESQAAAIAEPDTAQLPAAEATPAETQAETLTVKALAEKLELRPQDLYKQLMIDVGSGDPISLSELKDAGAKLHKADKILTEAETHRQDAENELLRHRQAVSEMPVTDEQLADSDKRWDEYVRVENASSLKIISAWKEPTQQRADLTEMSELMTGYGFRPAEIARMADHRFVKAFYDLMTHERRVRAVGESEVTQHKAPVVKAKRKSATKSGAKAVEQYKAGNLSHSEAVAALIAEG